MPTIPTAANDSTLALADVVSETAAQLRVLAHLPADELTGETDSFGLSAILSRLADDLATAETAAQPGAEAAVHQGVPKTPKRLRYELEFHRQDLENGPASVHRVLTLVYDLLHDSALSVADPSPLATQGNLAALVDCARLATDMLDYRLDAVFEALDEAEGAA
ncbi:hypothetical protein [uncultured Lamprocystis sp.]|jgi:hypothetical protein|uniref:hypothetical protein n=1 Tax=uncultured Lamprocystis sp. TaxID=543132 RepID=UPI0025E09812|nr:hypothetical protein [uncultured Lamprocystis sp.]